MNTIHSRGHSFNPLTAPFHEWVSTRLPRWGILIAARSCSPASSGMPNSTSELGAYDTANILAQKPAMRNHT